MNREKIIELLKESGVIMEGHFSLTSGRHSSLFLQFSRLFQYPERTSAICTLMADPYRDEGIETVIGPAMGGVIPAYESARQLQARALYAEPSEGRMILRRGFSIQPGERVLVVEDAVTTGGSVQKVLDLLQALNADVAGVSVLADRSGGRVDFGMPFQALLTMEVESHPVDSCPLCVEGITLQKPKG